MNIDHLFWQIIGFGYGIPALLVLIQNLALKSIVGDEYHLDLKKITIVYSIALVGFAVALGIK